MNLLAINVEPRKLNDAREFKATEKNQSRLISHD